MQQSAITQEVSLEQYIQAVGLGLAVVRYFTCHSQLPPREFSFNQWRQIAEQAQARDLPKLFELALGALVSKAESVDQWLDIAGIAPETSPACRKAHQKLEAGCQSWADGVRILWRFADDSPLKIKTLEKLEAMAETFEQWKHLSYQKHTAPKALERMCALAVTFEHWKTVLCHSRTNGDLEQTAISKLRELGNETDWITWLRNVNESDPWFQLIMTRLQEIQNRPADFWLKIFDDNGWLMEQVGQLCLTKMEQAGATFAQWKSAHSRTVSDRLRKTIAARLARTASTFGEIEVAKSLCRDDRLKLELYERLLAFSPSK